MNFECWAVGTWAAFSWVVGSWCPGAEPASEEIHLLEPFYIWDERKELKRKQEEAILIL